MSGLNLKRALKKYKPKIIPTYGRPLNPKIFSDPIEQFMDDNWNQLLGYSPVYELKNTLNEAEGSFLMMLHHNTENEIIRLFVNIKKIRDSMLNFYTDDVAYELATEKIQKRLALMLITSSFMRKQISSYGFFKILMSKAKNNFFIDLDFYDWKKCQTLMDNVKIERTFGNLSMELYYYSKNIFARGHDNCEVVNNETLRVMTRLREVNGLSDQFF